MSGLPVTIVDAFTREPGAGNRAGIVLDAPELAAEDMLAIARAVAASETAFVRPGTGGVDYAFRYFAPGAEIDFCGHNTVATFHLLAELGRVQSSGRYTLQCPAGRVEVELEPVQDHTRVWMATPLAPWEPCPIPLERLAALLGGSRSMLAARLPVMRSGSKLYVPFERRSDLTSLTPRWDDLAAAGLEHGIKGFYALTLEAQEKGHVSQGRFFAPALGVREDPATGSASGPLAEYLALHGVLTLPATGGTVRATAEQGYAMGKPGLVELEVSGRPGAIERVRAGGVAVTVLEGALRTPRAASTTVSAATTQD
jgi:trans-2,3-dihydro-3-hydroxyanthranilate isomerase